MSVVELEDKTIERLDALRIDNESYDEVVTELINSYENEGLTLSFGDDSV